MSPEAIQIGAVFQPSFDERPIRLIAVDDREVMYDSWWPHRSAWGFASLPGTVSYYRMPRRVLLERCRYLRSEPLSPAELDVHRPDLPLRFGASPDLEWPDADQLEAFPGRIAASFPSSLGLAATRLYLCPFGPKGRSKPGVLVEPDAPHAATIRGLLARAAAIQAPHLRDQRPTRGIGVYRLGLQRKVPSYYLWGSQSKADADR
jgi:hypothetical protein